MSKNPRKVAWQVSGLRPLRPLVRPPSSVLRSPRSPSRLLRPAARISISISTRPEKHALWPRTATDSARILEVAPARVSRRCHRRRRRPCRCSRRGRRQRPCLHPARYRVSRVTTSACETLSWWSVAGRRSLARTGGQMGVRCYDHVFVQQQHPSPSWRPLSKTTRRLPII